MTSRKNPARAGAGAPLRAAVLLCAALLAQGASAHALLVGSEPADQAVLQAGPEAVLLRFNSKLEKGLSKVELLGEQGAATPLSPSPGAGEPAELLLELPALEAGAYTVRYKVLATDGHTTEGILRFTVAAP